MNYIDLHSVEQDGEERTELRDLIAQSLDVATEQGIGAVRIVFQYRRTLPNGNYDNPRPGRFLTFQNATTEPDTAVTRIVTRIQKTIGRGFRGQVIVGVEDAEHEGRPLAGVWDRNVVFGDAADDPYGMSGGMPMGGGGGMSMGGGMPMGGGGMHGGGGGTWGGGGGGMPPQGPSGHGHGPSQHGPGGFDRFSAPAPPPLRGFDSFDPGGLGEMGSPEDRELVRSVIGGMAREKDTLYGELRARDENFFRMLDYSLRQNHQFMQFFGMVFGRGLPASANQGAAPMHPLVAALTGIASMFFPAPQAAPPVGHDTPRPPEITSPPPMQQHFYEPAGDPADLNFDPPTEGGSYDPHSQAGGSWRPPSNEEEWEQAFSADPQGAKNAAAKIVPKPFAALLRGSGGSNQGGDGGGHGPQ